MKKEKKSAGKVRFADFLVVLFCLSGAAFSVNLFRLDLFRTLGARGETPIGTVTIKRNTVQRRTADRVLWDRLVRESPVYSNDTIRVSELSEANLRVGGNDITLNENTLVRLLLDRETGGFTIELTSGNMELVTGGGDIILNIAGRLVEPAPGTALSAAAGSKGTELQISEGAVTVREESGSRELAAGTALALDSEGSPLSEPAVMMKRPRPDARYRKSANEPFTAVFSWNRINLPPDDAVRLEIAGDQHFSRIVRTLDGLYDSAQTALDAGMWNWRLTLGGAVLALGRVSVTDAEPELLSPAGNQRFYHEAEPPKLYFQWSEVEDVTGYVVEVDVTPEFRNPVIRKQTAVTSFTDSDLGPGIWYWRVTPVFSPASGNAAFSVSRNAAFYIVKDEVPQAAPPPEPAPVPQPETPPPKNVTLESPNQGSTLPGLTALRQQTVFRWNSEEAVAKSRFVLSRDPNPLRGRPAVEITDPNRTVRLDRLEEGIWY
ncbi:MAG: hypothetical protein LBG91_01425, partial [Treponema sp.]|nr:hypothetical protein [Treponema sp.]